MGHANVFMSSKKATTNNVSEVYSPLRTAQRASIHGLGPGLSFDFTERTPSRQPWGFGKADLKQQALQKHEEDQPEMLMVSPICGHVSQFQGPNYSQMDFEQS